MILPNQNNSEREGAATLGYEFAHLGINCVDVEIAKGVSSRLSEAFGFRSVELPNSIFVSGSIEVTKSIALGGNGHIAIYTTDIERAIEDLVSKGIEVDQDTIGYRDGKMVSIYLKESIGDFAVHLLLKQ